MLEALGDGTGRSRMGHPYEATQGDKVLGDKIKREGEDQIMVKKYISRISSVEIPVSDLEASVEWYTRILGLQVQHKGDAFAMLTFDAVGVPGVFLCETRDTGRLQFENTNNGVIHSMIDFYTDDLKGFHEFLVAQGVQAGELKIDTNSDFGGFGFRDPDGNLLGACNAIQRGQV